MKHPGISEDNFQLHARGAELRSMAMRQQQQIDTQHQMLAAKEQRLKFLKSQETRNAFSIAEAERLRRLRERVEAQESKLRRLRALRGQVDLQKTYNVTLGNDLDSIRALFSEKEKELTLAVAKVEALTRQLEELRRDRRSGGSNTNSISFNFNANSLNPNGSPAAKELEKLRLELAYRNQMSIQQNARLSMQREALQQRQIELHSVDKRIVELQSRINKKRILNVQNYKINGGSNASVYGQHMQSKTTSPTTNLLLHSRSSSTHLNPSHSRSLSRGNIVAVEPFNHYPVSTSSPSNGISSSLANSSIPNEKNQQSISEANDFLQQQRKQQQQYRRQIENSVETMGADEAMLLAPESDEKKLAVRQQQQYRSRYDEKQGQLETETELGSVVAKPSYTEQQSITNNIDNEMEIQSDSPTIYDDENGHFVTLNTNNVSGDFENDTVASTVEKELCQTTPGANKGKPILLNSGSDICNINIHHNRQQFNARQLKPTHSFLQNIPLGNLVAPPRKPVNSVAPTLAMKSIPPASSLKLSENVSAKITSVTRKISSGGNSSSVLSNEIEQTSSPTSPNNNNRPALPPKPNKSATSVNANVPGTLSANANITEEGGIEMNNTASVGGLSMSGDNDSSSTASYDMPDLSQQSIANKQTIASDKLPIKAKPLTIRKQHFLEQPKLKNLTGFANNGGNSNCFNTAGNVGLGLSKLPNNPIMQHQMIIKRKESVVAGSCETGGLANESVLYSSYENDGGYEKKYVSEVDDSNIGRNHAVDRLKRLKNANTTNAEGKGLSDYEVTRRKRNFNSTCANVSDICGGHDNGKLGVASGNKTAAIVEGTKHKLSRRVSFDPLALLLDASLEGELELVEKTAMQVTNPSAANDEGITALHNAICAGHFEIVKFLVNFGCDVNAQDSDGWTPLHCAASCNNLPMVKFLVESGACLFAATLSDHETPAEKCEEDEEGFDGCSEYLYSIQEKLGILSNGEVYAVFSYESQQPDELSFFVNDKLIIIRKGDETEREWWWARNTAGKEGYVPRNLLGLHPRLAPSYMGDI